jgi:hypothetical protein
MLLFVAPPPRPIDLRTAIEQNFGFCVPSPQSSSLWPRASPPPAAPTTFITLQDFNVHGANTTHGTDIITKLLGTPSDIMLAQVRMCLVTALFSSFVYGTPVVSLGMPVGNLQAKAVITLVFEACTGGPYWALLHAASSRSLPSPHMLLGPGRHVDSLSGLEPCFFQPACLPHSFKPPAALQFCIMLPIVLTWAAKARLPIRQLLIPLTYCCLLVREPAASLASAIWQLHWQMHMQRCGCGHACHAWPQLPTPDLPALARGLSCRS